MTFVLASNNSGKLREFAPLFESMGLEVVAQRDFAVPDAEETGLSFIENAILKARHAAHATGRPAIADDSGLVVPALGGAPGIYSARYSGGGDTDNNAKLLSEMSHLRGEDRAAFYVAVIAVVMSASDPLPIIAEGRWYGNISFELSGTGGFGYDPLFIPESSSCTAAEMSAAEKQALSHRAKALKALAPKLSNCQ
ncbi:RdgB/HAM1 family non-canonical purine NTP pyrophosphatase [Luminiphilus sp.]|jgi:XTP/dITP diphosphohydrolase|nr:RdgB/HAM1 family non-canonical purine NTP pyrophosphatase [Luminiphilus sp.]